MLTAGVTATGAMAVQIGRDHEPEVLTNARKDISAAQEAAEEALGAVKSKVGQCVASIVYAFFSWLVSPYTEPEIKYLSSISLIYA